MRNAVRLNIAIVILARPHEAAIALHRKRHHVINQAMLIPQFLRLKLRFIFPKLNFHIHSETSNAARKVRTPHDALLVHLLEDVFELAVILL